jgi:hypothetical protein
MKLNVLNENIELKEYKHSSGLVLNRNTNLELSDEDEFRELNTNRNEIFVLSSGMKIYCSTFEQNDGMISKWYVVRYNGNYHLMSSKDFGQTMPFINDIILGFYSGVVDAQVSNMTNADSKEFIRAFNLAKI